MKRLIVAGMLIAVGSVLLGSGCSRYTERYWGAMDLQKQRMLNPQGQADKTEYQLDRAVSEAFDMMMQTIPPSDRHVKSPGILHPLSFHDVPWRVGLVETASQNSQPMKFDDYVAEKTRVLAGLDRDFNHYFEMTEASTPEDMQKELNPANPGSMDTTLTANWGKLHKLDFVITEVTTPSPNMVDLSLKLVQVMTGRVVAVGSSKMPRDESINQWLTEPGK